MQQWMQLVMSLLAGLITAIPLAIKLVEYVRKAVKEKNWSKMVDLVVKLMEEAEVKLESGADKKQWVLAMVKASADTINYDVDLDEISTLIDNLCDMSKVVNSKPVESLKTTNN